jgi:hypothetical protein
LDSTFGASKIETEEDLEVVEELYRQRISEAASKISEKSKVEKLYELASSKKVHR